MNYFLFQNHFSPCSVHFPSDEQLEEHSDFLVVPRHQELLGDRAKECDIHVSMEKTSLEDGRHYLLSYVLFRCVCSPVYFPFLISAMMSVYWMDNVR